MSIIRLFLSLMLYLTLSTGVHAFEVSNKDIQLNPEQAAAKKAAAKKEAVEQAAAKKKQIAANQEKAIAVKQKELAAKKKKAEVAEKAEQEEIAEKKSAVLAKEPPSLEKIIPEFVIERMYPEGPKNKIRKLYYYKDKKDLQPPKLVRKKIKSKSGDMKTILLLEVQTRYKRKNWDLTYTFGTKEVTAKEKELKKYTVKKDRVRAIIRGPETPIDFYAIGPKGEVKRTRWVVHFVNYALYVKSMEPREVEKKNFFSAGVSFTLINYTDTRLTQDLQETALTVKFGYTRAGVIFKKMVVGAGVFFAALPISHSGGQTALSSAEPTVKYLGLNLRVGYQLTKKNAWTVNLMGGAYWLGMTVDPEQLGFTNVFGPQLYPTVRYQFENGKSISAYLKFSPVSATFGSLSFSDREIAFGARFGLKRNAKGRGLQFGFDLSSLAVTIVGVPLTSNTVSIGADYAF